MNFFTNSIVKKLWLTIAAAIIVTIIVSYFLSYLFYQKLYVDIVENSLFEEGTRLSYEYKGGPLSVELKEKIEWYNTKSDSEVFVVSNPRELSACLPFDIHYDTLIGEEERELLLKGESIRKNGFEERFDRKIMAVIIPLLDGNRLEGIIYLYVPLAKITELMSEFATLWIIGAALFLIVAVFLGIVIIQHLTKPITDIKEAANVVSKGDYSVRVKIQSQDEVGQLAAAFNKMSASIQKEDERKRDFLANISHELRTPISYISGYSEALMNGMVKSEEEKVKFLGLIHREAGRMGKLVGDLLDLARLDAEEFSLVKHPLPLAQLIEDALIKYEPIAEQKEITIIKELDPDIIISGDEGRMEQILQNLMDNAIRYTESEGTIHIKLGKKDQWGALVIKDTGIGIPNDEIGNIKQRFYRINKARTRSNGGTGLGLAIVDKLIQLHGGKWDIQSQLGEGTSVTILLPLLEEDE